jgi:hypothetical protein
MKSLISIFLFVGIVTLYIGCSDNNPSAPALSQSDQVTGTLDKKPAPNLIGHMELNFVMGTQGDVAWDGTIEFEDDGIYGIRFHHLSPSKGYSQASPFEEYFEIYDLGTPAVIYLAGPDEGLTTLANKLPGPVKYRMNGEIEVANTPFEMWLGRNVHISGVINGDPVLLIPVSAPGTFRIN